MPKVQWLRFPASTVGLSVASWLAIALISVACQPTLLNPPRLATQAAQGPVSPIEQATPFVSNAPTPTSGAQPELVSSSQEVGRNDQSLTIWVNETSSAHEKATEQIVEAFSSETGIQVELVLVADDLLPDLVQTAVISGSLPDLLLHPIEYSVGWAEQGILDGDAATEVVARLGYETIDPGALKMATIESGSDIAAAIPVDGRRQLLVYRADWFAELGLSPPDNFESLLNAAETTFQPDDLIAGLVVPTDSTLASTQQTFEWIAMANGCELADDKGEVTLLHPACLEALEYYRVLINEYSPIGVQTDTSALNAYLAGRTGIIAASPEALPAIAGLVEDKPPICPRCETPDYLARNSALITSLVGRGEFAGAADFGQITALGLTSAANTEAAIELATHWLDSGYSEWIAIDPVRKVPMRLGTSEQPLLFRGQWGELPLIEGGPSLSGAFGEEIVSQLENDVATPGRWGFKNGQATLSTRIYEELVLSPLLQEMLSGYFTSSQTIIDMQRAVAELIPNYRFPVPIAPTDEP